MSLHDVDLIRATTLAYVGDSVFSLFIRAKLSSPTVSTSALMKRSSLLVSAVMQAKIYDGLSGFLTSEELALSVRCLNAHVTNKAKNATMREYKKATALEGLLGALYLSGEAQRLNEILEQCFIIGEANE